MTQAAIAAQEELELAIEDGFVRIYGREVAECFYGRPVATAALSLEVLLSAIEQLLEVIQRSAADAADLPRKVRDAEDPLEASSHCASVLHLERDIWAAFVAIDAVHSQHLDEGDSPLAEGMTRLLRAMNDHDDNVQCPETLRVLREGLALTSLLDNWRKMLSKSEQAKDILPWFLDGTLDA